MSRVTDGEARVIALQAGRATVEIIDWAQCRHIDDPEVGRQICRNIHAAFEVTDVNHAIDIVARARVELVAAPTETRGDPSTHAMERRALGHPKRHRPRSEVPSAFP